MYPMYDRWGSHPGRGLTPERVIAIYRAAEYGWPQQQCDLFEDVIESDGHLRSLLETRHDAVAGRPWVVAPGGDSAADIRAANELQDALAEIPQSMNEMLGHHLGAMTYGYAGSQIYWDRVDGLWVPRWFSDVPPRRFRFDENDNPYLLTVSSPALGVPLERGSWIWTRRRHRVAAMAGLMRTGTWWAMFKRWGVRDAVLFSEKYGIPYPIGKYGDGMPKEEKAILREAVASLGTEGYACFSKNGDIEIIKVDGGGSKESPQLSLAQFCNNELSKVVAGATLTSGEGTSAGSYAMATIHEGTSFQRTLADAKDVGLTIQQQLGAMFVHFNRMDNAKPPGLKVHVVRDQSPKERMLGMSIYANELGGELDDDQVRLEMQYKHPTGKILKGTKAGGSGAPFGGSPNAQ